MPTEAEFEETPDAVRGRALLEAGLAKVGATEQEAFRAAVRRCYASAAEEDTEAAAGQSHTHEQSRAGERTDEAQTRQYSRSVHAYAIALEAAEGS